MARSNCINLRKNKSELLVINPKGTLGFHGDFQSSVENKRKKSIAWECIYSTTAYAYMTDMGSLKIGDGNLGNLLQLMENILKPLVADRKKICAP